MKICGPCYKCERRKPLCHSECPEYKAYKQANADKAEIIRKAKAEDKAVREIRGRAAQIIKAKHGG